MAKQTTYRCVAFRKDESGKVVWFQCEMDPQKVAAELAKQPELLAKLIESQLVIHYGPSVTGSTKPSLKEAIAYLVESKKYPDETAALQRFMETDEDTVVKEAQNAGWKPQTGFKCRQIPGAGKWETTTTKPEKVDGQRKAMVAALEKALKK